MDSPAPDPGDPPPPAADDGFAPPAEACECYCLHCERVVDSRGIWWQPVVNGPPGEGGTWMCPTPNCDGVGFGFDLHPTDPDHPANDGWHGGADGSDDDDDEEGEESSEYDPAEPQWADEVMGGDDDDDDEDLEGEEWKLGLQPGERPPPSAESAAAAEASRQRWAEEQRKYDEPDRRPRSVDGSDWTRPVEGDDRPGWGDDSDIPF